jgi:hypothetical protein
MEVTLKKPTFKADPKCTDLTMKTGLAQDVELSINEETSLVKSLY